jgi:ribonuclease HII
LSLRPSYVLTDGFPVAGIGAPGLAVWKGDQVAACIAAASVIAKVTRDRMMCELHDQYPAYGFAEHKGYVTKFHQRALAEYGPCAEHRRSFVNVRAAGQVDVIDTSDLDDQMSDNGDVRDVDLIEIAAEA